MTVDLTPEAVHKHMASLMMSSREIAARAGISETAVKRALRATTIRQSTAAAILAVRPNIAHQTTINGHNRVECGCGFRSQRFGTLGLAKARARTHQTTGE